MSAGHFALNFRLGQYHQQISGNIKVLFDIKHIAIEITVGTKGSFPCFRFAGVGTPWLVRNVYTTF